MSTIISTTDEEFENDTSDGVILVEFYADWCKPCQMVAPILNEIADEYDGRLQIVKLNIDEHELTPSKFDVRGIPTIILFQNNQAVGTKVGALSKSQLVNFIETNI